MTTRLFSEHGTTSIGSEIARSVNQMQQFQSTRHSGQTISEVIAIGFSGPDFEVTTESLAALGLPMKELPSVARISAGSSSLAECFLHAGVLVLKRTEANLYGPAQAARPET